MTIEDLKETLSSMQLRKLPRRNRLTVDTLTQVFMFKSEFEEHKILSSMRQHEKDMQHRQKNELQ